MYKEESPAVKKLISQVDKIMSESSDTKNFDSKSWVLDWINEPQPALGNKKPYLFLDSQDGFKQVSKIIAQIQSGTYA